MKLRNKKTGEIAKKGLLKSDYNGNHIIVYPEGTLKYYAYNSLAELNDEWEDYTPSEPLIKDEDKLDSVKSFFLMLGITKDIYYQSINNCFWHEDDDGIAYSIDFVGDKGIEDLCIGIPYALAELCGEGEE